MEQEQGARILFEELKSYKKNNFIMIVPSLALCARFDVISYESTLLSKILYWITGMAQKNINVDERVIMKDDRILIKLSYNDIASVTCDSRRGAVRTMQNIIDSNIMSVHFKGKSAKNKSIYDVTDFFNKWWEVKDLVEEMLKDNDYESIKKEISNLMSNTTSEPKAFTKPINLFEYIVYKAKGSFEGYVSPPFRTAVKSVVKCLFDNKEISLEDKKLAVDYATDSGEYDSSKFIIPFIFCQANIGVLIAKAKKWDKGGRNPIEDSAKFIEKFSNDDTGHKNKVGLKIIK